MALRSGAIPLVAVYRVKFSSIACSAASLTFRGVGKSGSPAPRSIRSTPSARNRSASIKTASVDETSMPDTLIDSLNVFLLVLNRTLRIYYRRFKNYPQQRPSSRPSDGWEFVAHSFLDGRRHQAVDRTAQLEHFLYEPRADIRVSFASHEEYGLNA